MCRGAPVRLCPGPRVAAIDVASPSHRFGVSSVLTRAFCFLPLAVLSSMGCSQTQLVLHDRVPSALAEDYPYRLRSMGWLTVPVRTLTERAGSQPSRFSMLTGSTSSLRPATGRACSRSPDAISRFKGFESPRSTPRTTGQPSPYLSQPLKRSASATETCACPPSPPDLGKLPDGASRERPSASPR